MAGVTGDRADPGNYFAPHYTVRFFAPNKTDVAGPDGFGTPLGALAGSVGAAVTRATRAAQELSVTLKSDENESGVGGLGSQDESSAFLRTVVDSLLIEGVSSDAYKLTMTMSAPYDAAILILDNKLIRFGAIVEVAWGYFTEGERIVSRPHVFRITQPTVQFGQTTSITFVGQDIFSYLAAERRTSRSWKRTQFKTNLEILQGVGKHLGFEVDASAVPATSTLYGKEGAGEEQSETYWRFFRRICLKHKVGFVADSSAKTLKLYDFDDVARQPVSYNLLWRRAITDAKMDIPIKSITINPIGALFQGRPETPGIKTPKPNNDQGSVTTGKKDAAGLSIARPGVSKQSAAGSKSVPNVVIDTPFGPINPAPDLAPEDTGAQVTASSQEVNSAGKTEGILHRGSDDVNITATAIVPGHPALHPQQVVKILGLPKIFSSNYLIRSVKHRIGKGYETELDLFTRTSSQDPKGAGQRSLGPPGGSTPPVDGTKPARTANGDPA